MPEIIADNFNTLIGVGGTLLGATATQFYNWIIMRISFRTKQLSEAYNKRLAVYDDVLKELTAMVNKLTGSEVQKLSINDMLEILLKGIFILDDIRFRLSIYGSVETAATIKILRDQIDSMQDLEMLSEASSTGTIKDVYILYVGHIEIALSVFANIMSIETGNDFLNKINKRKAGKVAKALADFAKGNFKPDNKFY